MRDWARERNSAWPWSYCLAKLWGLLEMPVAEIARQCQPRRAARRLWVSMDSSRADFWLKEGRGVPGHWRPLVARVPFPSGMAIYRAGSPACGDGDARFGRAVGIGRD